MSKFSEFTSQASPQDTDEVVGLRSTTNSRFTLAAIRALLASVANTAGKATQRDTDGSIDVGAVNLDVAASPTSQEGQIRWNATDKCAEVVQDGGVILQVGQEVTVRARNNSGATLANGAPVYVMGATGNRPTVANADADSIATAQTLIGLVTDSAGIANNADGHVTVFGLVRDLDTSAFTEGQIVYLSDGAAGTLTATKPVTASSFVVRVGFVTRAHATQGVILVAPHFHGSVTADALMVATSQAAACTAIGAIPASEKGAAGGVALADLSNPAAVTALAERIPDEQLWVFPSFSSTQQKLQMLVSGDGINWRLFATDVYAAASLTFRDPSPLWHDGWWYIAHSNVASGTFVGNVLRIIRSRDLLNWTAYAGITVTGQTYAWSPEWFVDTDGSVRIYFAASSTDLNGFAMYSITPTVAGDFSAWDAPVEVYDTVSCIDASVVLSGGTYYMFYKNETSDELEVASATAPDGPFVRIGEVNSSWAAEYEGASIHQMPDGTWRLYADKYTGSNQGYYYAESTSLTSGWSAFTAITTNTGGLWTVRHGTPLRVTGDATRSVLAAVSLATNLIRGLITKGGGGGTDQGLVFTDPILISEASGASWAQRQLYHFGGSGTYKALTEAMYNDSWQGFRGLEASGGAAFLWDCNLATRAMRWYGDWRAATYTADQQSLSGAGAIDIITGTTLLTTTGANALTLANGTAGQRKTIIMVVDGGDGTLTPTTKTGYTTITFTAVGQAVTLEYVTTLGWMIVSNNGATVA